MKALQNDNQRDRCRKYRLRVDQALMEQLEEAERFSPFNLAEICARAVNYCLNQDVWYKVGLMVFYDEHTKKGKDISFTLGGAALEFVEDIGPAWTRAAIRLYLDEKMKRENRRPVAEFKPAAVAGLDYNAPAQLAGFDYNTK